MSRIVMIAAAGEKGALGRDNKLLWHLPDDFKRFKRLTTGHPIIMGRKTFESFPKPLPMRHHIIITRNPDFSAGCEECTVVHDLQEALELVAGKELAYIIGGGEIYRLAMEVSDAIELTRVHGIFEADTFFPQIDPVQWKLVAETYHPKDEKHAYAFTYRTFERIQDRVGGGDQKSR